ncbi:MAG: radical SAM protein [Vicinamibacterales bacterium]
MKILLVCPPADFALWARVQQQSAGNIPDRAYTVPLHLATVAALTPAGHEVRIWDESVRGEIDEHTDLGGPWDLVGVTGYSNHLARANRIGDFFQARGVPVVIGGAGVTSEPETCRDHFDVVFIGEAEQTWPRFVAEFEAGTHAAEYRATAFPDLADSPPPRWDSIADDMSRRYVTAGLQVNRGCPYTCEFCNVWTDFGRAIRTKPIPQVLDELRTLSALGMRRALICTDNFVGNPKYAKALLREMIALNESFPRPMQFYTELTLNISKDAALLELLADARFSALFIGIESVSEESLKETRKRHNINRGLVEQCRTIQSWGMPIQGSMILGFDHDHPGSFDATFQFLQEACIVTPRLNLLKALASTDLLTRLGADGRVIDRDRAFPDLPMADPVRAILSNVIPQNMTRVEMFEGYLDLLERVWDWKNVEARVTGFLDLVARDPREPDEASGRVVAMMRSSFPLFPGVDLETIERVIAHTEATQPRLLENVCSLLLIACGEAARLPMMREALVRHIARERALGDAPPLLEMVV